MDKLIIWGEIFGTKIFCALNNLIHPESRMNDNILEINMANKLIGSKVYFIMMILENYRDIHKSTTDMHDN